MRNIYSFICLFITLGLFSSSAFANSPGFLFEPLPAPQNEKSLKALSRGQGIYHDYFKIKLAEHNLKQQKYTSAIKFAGSVQSNIYRFWAKTIEAEAYLGLNKPAKIPTLLRQFPMPPKPELSYGEETYNNVYKRALWAKWQASKQKDKRTFGLLYAVAATDPGFKTYLKDNEIEDVILKPEDKIVLLHNLHFARRHKETGGILTTREILKAKFKKETKCQALFEWGNTLRMKKASRHLAVEPLKLVTQKDCPDDLITRSLYRLGNLGRLLKDENLVKHSFTKLYSAYPGSRLADDGYYGLYKYYLKNGNEALSKKYLTKLMNLKKGDMRNAVLFEWGFSQYKKKKYSQAAKTFARVFKSEPSRGENYTRNIYWHARSLEKTGQKKNIAKAKKSYENLMQKFPFSFYAVLSSQRLEKKLTYPRWSLPKREPHPNDLELFDALAFFSSKDFHMAGRATLDFFLHENPGRIGSHKETIVGALIQSQNYRKALDIAANHFDSGVYGPLMQTGDPLFAAFYPKAFSDETSMGYQKTELPKGTIEGIMREESLFQRNAVSHVGASGLMQLMPGTARMVRQEIGTPAYALTNPSHNILLGSTYLRKMKSYFKEQLPLAIMAYNAGPGNVRKWMRKLKSSPKELDEFIEEVPFSETKGYVKRVLRTMNVYGSLYKDPYFKKKYLSFKIKPLK